MQEPIKPASASKPVQILDCPHMGTVIFVKTRRKETDNWRCCLAVPDPWIVFRKVPIT